MIDVDISKETADRMHAVLEGMGLAEEKVLKPALARGLSAGKTAFNKQIKTVYNIEPNRLSTQYAQFGYKNVSTEGDKIIGSIEFSGGVIPLYKFEVSPTEAKYGTGRKTVMSSVMRGGGAEAINNGFIAEMGNGYVGVFERKGTWRRKTRPTQTGRNTENNEKIKELFGPSLARMAENTVVLQTVEDRVNEVINKRIEHEIERLLSKNGG